MINYSSLKLFTQDELNNYLWKRLRLESQDPPLGDYRHSDPPETFIYNSIIKNNDNFLKINVLNSILFHIEILTIESQKNNLYWDDVVNDQHVASLFFLSTTLELIEIYDKLYDFSLFFLNNWLNNMTEPSDGQFHALRFLVQYTKQDLSNIWNNILFNGPESLETLCLQALSFSK